MNAHTFNMTAAPLPARDFSAIETELSNAANMAGILADMLEGKLQPRNALSKTKEGGTYFLSDQETDRLFTAVYMTMRLLGEVSAELDKVKVAA